MNTHLGIWRFVVEFENVFWRAFSSLNCVVVATHPCGTGQRKIVGRTRGECNTADSRILLGFDCLPKGLPIPCFWCDIWVFPRVALYFELFEGHG